MDMDANMDLLQGIQEAAGGAPGEAGAGAPPGDGMPFQMPPLEKMIEILSQMDIPEEDKAQLLDSLKNRGDFLSKMGGMTGGMPGAAQSGGPPSPVAGLDPTAQFLLFFTAFLIVAILFAFFGYKLYKSLMDREKKREEKKKLKQQKKKK